MPNLDVWPKYESLPKFVNYDPEGVLLGRIPRAASSWYLFMFRGTENNTGGGYEWRERPGTSLPGIWRIVCGM